MKQVQHSFDVNILASSFDTAVKHYQYIGVRIIETFITHTYYHFSVFSAADYIYIDIVWGNVASRDAYKSREI